MNVTWEYIHIRYTSTALVGIYERDDTVSTYIYLYASYEEFQINIEERSKLLRNEKILTSSYITTNDDNSIYNNRTSSII